MKKLVAILGIVFATHCFADPGVQSGDVIQIGDFRFVALSVGDFERMKLTVDDLKAKWAKMNSNETGRTALHGRRGHTTITNGTVQAIYEDGYTHITPIAQRKSVSREKPSGKAAALTPWEIRRQAIRRGRREALSRTNEVSVAITR